MTNKIKLSLQKLFVNFLQITLKVSILTLVQIENIRKSLISGIDYSKHNM